jgi:small-conductance mechanosensitive channel
MHVQKRPEYNFPRKLKLWFVLLICGFGLCPIVSDAQIGGPKAADEKAQTRSLAVRSVPDSELQEKLRNVLSRIDDFKDIHVSVQEGVVSLSGTVPRPSALKKAEQLISRFEGVIYVNNRISDDSDLEDQIVPVLTRITNYGAGFINKLPILGIATVAFLFFYGLSHIGGVIVSKTAWFGENRLARSLFARMIKTVIILIGLFIALDILDITALVGAVVGTAGVLGLALGFAFKDIVENYLAGIILSIRRPFAVRDFIAVDGNKGNVLRLTSREVVLMTVEGNHVLIPNAMVFKSVISNYTRNNLRQFSFRIGIGMKEDLRVLKTIGNEALLSTTGVLSDPAPYMQVERIGDFSIEVQFFGWVDQKKTDFFAVKSEALRNLKEALDSASVELPFPTSLIFYDEITGKKMSDKKQSPKTNIRVEDEDVSVKSDLSKQIQKDIQTSKEENLLTQ